jgi:hypothetical protein
MPFVAWALVVVALSVGACSPASRPTDLPKGSVSLYVAATPTPAPTPIPSAAARAVASFERLIDKGKLTYHLKGSGRDVLFDRPEQWSLDADVSPTEYGGSAKAGGQTVRFAFVDGAGWAKTTGAPWFRLPVETSVIPDLIRPWGYLCPRGEMQYAGPADAVAGASTFTCPAGFKVQTPRMMHAGLVLTIDELTLVLASDGKPVTLVVKGQYPGNASRLADSFSFTLAFSRVGKAVKISGP